MEQKIAVKPKIKMGVLLFVSLPLIGLYALAASAVFYPQNYCSNATTAFARLSSIFSPCRIKPITTPVPLLVADLSELYSDVFDHPFGKPEIRSCNQGDLVFYSGTVELGRLLANKENCPGEIYYSDGSSYQGESTPFQVTSEGGDILLNQHITLRTSDSKEHTLCLPQLTAGQSVYFSSDGTPYWDKNLTQQAISEKCSVQLQRGMIFNVYDASNDSFYPSGFDYHALARGHLMFPDVWEFGYLYGNINGFDREVLCGDCYQRAYGKAPLVLAPHPTGDIIPLDIPGDIVTVWNVSNEVKDICVPPTRFNGVAREIYDSEAYFIGADGTAYTDPFLTQKPMSEACASILNRTYHPNDLSQAGLTQLIGKATLIFHRGKFYNIPNQLGAYNESDEDPTPWIDGNALAANSGRAPLIIAVQNKTENDLVFKNQVVTFLDDTDNVTTACLAGMTLKPNNNIILYLDKYGDAYTDALLQNKANSFSCTERFNNIPRPRFIKSASTSALPDNVKVIFGRGDVYDNKVLGTIRKTGWEAGDLLSDSKILNSSAPLIISLGNTSEVNILWPQQQLNIETDVGNFQVCVPEQTLKSGPELLYLGSNNQLYHDALLQDLVSC